jgi:hypothetical protein
MTLAYVKFECSVVGPMPNAVFGNPAGELYKLGRFWFMYGDYAGSFIYLTHRKQLLLPELAGKSDGYKYIVMPGVKGVFHRYYTQVPDITTEIIGEAINLRLGKVAGLRQVGQTGFRGPSPRLISVTK